MTKKVRQSLLSAIERKYKSLKKPDFSFVDKSLKSKPYSSIISALENDFDIEYITELNYDVSFSYVLSKSEKKWALELSMIGPYAVLTRINEYNNTVSLINPNLCYPCEKDICSTAINGGVEFLEKCELEQHIEMPLFNTYPENVCIYHVLFSDTDFLPWKY